jgi:HK97 gp10 family phage protein
MATTTTRIEGMAELRRRLIATPRITRRLVADRVVQPTADATEARAFALVPVDEGDLARAITQDGRGLRRRVGIEAGAVGSRTGASSHQRPDVYGLSVEYGTRRMSARPFMRPAAETGGQVLERETRALAGELEREVGSA